MNEITLNHSFRGIKILCNRLKLILINLNDDSSIEFDAMNFYEFDYIRSSTCIFLKYSHQICEEREIVILESNENLIKIVADKILVKPYSGMEGFVKGKDELL